MRDEPLGEWIVHKLNRIDERTEIIMATLSDLVTEDAQLADDINQVVALLNQDTALITQLQGAIGSGNLTAQQQADVDNLFAQLKSQHDQVLAALTPTGSSADGQVTGTTVQTPPETTSGTPIPDPVTTGGADPATEGVNTTDAAPGTTFDHTDDNAAPATADPING